MISPMYEKYAVQVGGSVLEIGAGSGRLTIPLAQTGFAYCGDGRLRYDVGDTRYSMIV